MIYEFKGHRPVVDPSSFVHPQAAVTGDVSIGKNVYIGPGAAIRGDWGRIVIGDGCNVQENCTIHMFPGVTVWLKEGAHIGHGAIIHGAVIGHNCLIGMNSVIMDNAEIGDECIVGALSFIKAGEKVPKRSVIAGNPAKILKEVSNEMLQWKNEGTALYQALPAEMRESWRESEAARMDKEGQDAHSPGKDYKSWKETQYASGDQMPDEVQEPEKAYGKREFTIEDYLKMEEEATQKHEYYKGEIFAMAGARVDHNIITSNMMMFLAHKLWGSSCQVFTSGQRVHVEANTLFTYPDLTIVCGDPVCYNDDEMNLTNPVVIIEVLSPSTKNYDREDKFELYKCLPTLLEYLLVDSQCVFLEQISKDAKGDWLSRKYENLSDEFSIVTVGVSLTLADIYKNTRFPKLTH
jgi:phenylacetic acid degradation protein